MTGNRSAAVMQQRHEALDSLDDFPTPPFATRVATEFINNENPSLISSDMVAREPCANRGYMVRPLQEAYRWVLASDVHDYGAGYDVQDYLLGEKPQSVHWTWLNPPFVLAQEFILRAIATSEIGVAVFARSAFQEGEERYYDLFSQRPPRYILQFSERVVLHKSAMRRKGLKYWDPKKNDGEGGWRTASSATAYCWMIWIKGDTRRTETIWIPPSMARLERPGDYDLVGNGFLNHEPPVGGLL